MQRSGATQNWDSTCCLAMWSDTVASVPIPNRSMRASKSRSVSFGGGSVCPSLRNSSDGTNVEPGSIGGTSEPPQLVYLYTFSQFRSITMSPVAVKSSWAILASTVVWKPIASCEQHLQTPASCKYKRHHNFSLLQSVKGQRKPEVYYCVDKTSTADATKPRRLIDKSS